MTPFIGELIGTAVLILLGNGVVANVVLANRRIPPDAILREIYERTGDRPFERIESVISAQELKAISDRYKGIAGYDRTSLQA